jgi:predicted DNA binding CopG/RHH family protein
MARMKTEMPQFKTESREADWWASAEGRAFLKKKSKESRTKEMEPAGSRLVARLNQERTGGSTQIALRLPVADLEHARKIAERKGIGYQTLLKMLVHEGLEREARPR